MARIDVPPDDQVNRPIRVLFVNDHLGFPGNVTHGSTTYLSTVLPAFDRSVVDARICICRSWHPAAGRFEAAGVPLTFLGRGKWDVRVLTDLMSIVRRESIDILHLNGQKSHLLGRLAARATGRPAIIHLHMLYHPRPRFIQAWLARHTAQALGVSEPLRERAIAEFGIPPDKASVLHNGLEIERFARPPAGARERIYRELGLQETASVIGVLGRVTTKPDKGQRFAIEAMPAILRRYPGAVLLIVGDGPARPSCEALADELGLCDHVRFLGQRGDVEQIYAALDLVLVPSMVDEALGYSAIEGIAAGLPVVAFRGGGIPEVVLDEKTGLLVDKGDVSGLASAISRVIGDAALRERFGRAGRVHSASFRVDRHIEILEDLYRSLMQ